MNRAAIVFLILLRFAIGWHFFMEGVQKLESVRVGETTTNRPFSSAAYFREAPGPGGTWAREVVGDPDAEAVALLTVEEPEGDSAALPPVGRLAQERFNAMAAKTEDDFSREILNGFAGNVATGMATFFPWAALLPASLFAAWKARNLSTDKNMGWVRRDTWLTYLSLDAPDKKVTYDMSVTPMGVVKLATFGTKPMAIVDGSQTLARSADLPTAPMGTAGIAILLLIITGTAWLVSRRKA